MKKTGVVEEAAHTATHAATHVVTHPVSSVAYAVGLVRGVAVAVLRAAGGPLSSSPKAAEPDAAASPAPVVRAEPAEQRPPAPPSETFAHDPYSVEAHHSSSRRDEADLDDWYADSDPEADPAADSVVEALARNDVPGEDQVDHEAISAVLSESEILRGS
ncbi:MAG TPA: hypothetical protein VFE15_10115 [Marmoricola sp.]|jgi:hypothetical protein|nr:hypothetical protein [Marmoricola sp.]